MAANKALERFSPQTWAVPAVAAIKSGDPIMLGGVAGVANESDGDATRPSTGNVSVDTEGAFNLTVHAVTVLSPASNSAVKPGDLIYYDGGTTDSTTNVTYGGSLDKNSSGKLFGVAVDGLATGTTGTIRVMLKNAAS